MWYLIAAVAGIGLSVAVRLWYNARSAAVAENNAATEKALREEADRKAQALEEQRAADRAAAEKRDRDEATAVATDDEAVDFLRSSFN